MNSEPRQIRLGVIMTGSGANYTDWLDPAVQIDASIDINWYVKAARAAEAAKADFIFIVDTPAIPILQKSMPHFLNRLEPMTLLSALAMATSRIGLVATVTTSFNEPYNVARQLASLDMLSGGRAGWNVVTTTSDTAARNFGMSKHFDHADRYQRAEEFVAVTQGLWDSFEDDAIVGDRERAIFFDPDKIHALNHVGEYYSVAGPLGISRSRQGQPVIFQAGESPIGRDLCARIADAAFAAARDFDTVHEYAVDLKARAAAIGRRTGDPLVFPGMAPIIEDTMEQAIDRDRQRRGNIDYDKAVTELGRFFNDPGWTRFDPDAPFPDTPDLDQNAYKGMTDLILAAVRKDRLTLRQTVARFIERSSPFVGTPETIADEMERWFRAGAADGFNLHVAVPNDYNRFLTEVIPILQSRGLFRRDYEHETLRGHLGLDVPQNRWTAATQPAATTNPVNSDA